MCVLVCECVILLMYLVIYLCIRVDLGNSSIHYRYPLKHRIKDIFQDGHTVRNSIVQDVF